jgi:hypothetical protein
MNLLISLSYVVGRGESRDRIALTIRAGARN